MTFKVVILSAKASNLIPCIQAVLKHEPELPLDHIVVVDDGARAQAETALPGVTWVPGKKPFVFARNANLGIQAAKTDVILLNDDALLTTSYGFTHLEQQIKRQPRNGIYSAAIQGIVGNPRQRVSKARDIRLEQDMLA